MKSNKILITGAGGFLGSYIARELLKKGHEVFSFSRSNHDLLTNLGITQILGDLKNVEDVKLAMAGMDIVMHTAGMVGMWGRYEDYFETNVTGTENILKAMKELGINKLIYTSTPSVVFEKDSLCGVDESTPYASSYLTHYAMTKSIAEKMVLKANDKNFSTVSLRPHLIFGAGDKNLIPRVIEAQKKGRLKMVGDGTNLVDVIYVENAAMAHVMAMEKLAPNHPIAGKAYFLGQGPINLWDFINSVLTKAGQPVVTKKISLKKAYFLGFIIECFLKLFKIYKIHPPMTRFVSLQLGKSHYFNHHNIENDLGFKPSISIQEGIDRLFAENNINY